MSDLDLNRAWQPLTSAAVEVANALKVRAMDRVIFAESCTCGMCVAALGQVPGISRFLSGSAVTYRPQVKMDWLKIDAATIDRFTTESAEITRCMAEGVLNSTTDAQFSAAVTGHLGPIDNAEIDGIIFVAIAQRNDKDVQTISESQTKLQSGSRVERQIEAAIFVLNALGDQLGSGPGHM